MRALLLDEDESFAALAEFTLQRMGVHVDWFRSAGAFLDGPEAPLSDDPAGPEETIVLLDSTFGGERRAEVAAAVASRHPDDAIVLLSAAWRRVEDTTALEALDVDRVVLKPVDIVLLERDLAQIADFGEQNALVQADTAPADALRESYRATLESVRVAISLAETAVVDDEPLPEDLGRALERLSGTSGSYGYHSLSAQAQVAYGALGRYVASRPKPAPDARDQGEGDDNDSSARDGSERDEDGSEAAGSGGPKVPVELSIAEDEDEKPPGVELDLDDTGGFPMEVITGVSLANAQFDAPKQIFAQALQELGWLLTAALAAPAPPLTRQPSTLGPVRWPRSTLVVARDPGLVTAVGTELSAHGIDVRFAQTIDDAVELAEDYLPDLIVADFALRLDGPDQFPVDEELRTGFARAVPLVLSGVPMDHAERIRVANAGTAVFLDSVEEGAVIRAAQLLAPESYLGVTVLIVDDDELLTDLVTALLSPLGIRVLVAHQPTDLWALLTQLKPSLMLLDIGLPGFDGHQLCRTLKATPEYRDISVIYLTSDGRAETKVAAYQNGADDFMVKPIVGQEFVAKILGKLRHQQLAFKQMMTDPLTGVLSRRGLEKRLIQSLSGPPRPGRGVMQISIDGLEDMRREAGILTAERALREAAQALQNSVLGRDAVGRFGDDGPGELVVVLEDGAPAGFDVVYDRARKHLAGHPIFGPDGFFMQIGLNCGATSVFTRDSLSAVFSRCRSALDEARKDGRTLVVR